MSENDLHTVEGIVPLSACKITNTTKEITTTIGGAQFGASMGVFEGAIFPRACPTVAHTNTLQAVQLRANIGSIASDALGPCLATSLARLLPTSPSFYAEFRP